MPIFGDSIKEIIREYFSKKNYILINYEGYKKSLGDALIIW